MKTAATVPAVRARAGHPCRDGGPVLRTGRTSAPADGKLAHIDLRPGRRRSRISHAPWRNSRNTKALLDYGSTTLVHAAGPARQGGHDRQGNGHHHRQ